LARRDARRELVTVERRGRERIYALDMERLVRVVGGWIERFER
jgi:hypothetical protein